MAVPGCPGSRAYITQLQRDEAYRALRKSQQELLETNLELQRLMNMDGLSPAPLPYQRYLTVMLTVRS